MCGERARSGVYGAGCLSSAFVAAVHGKGHSGDLGNEFLVVVVVLGLIWIRPITTVSSVFR